MEFGWIQMEKHWLSIIVSDGDEVALPRENVTDSATWIFTGSRNAAAVELARLVKTEQNVVSHVVYFVQVTHKSRSNG